MSTEATQAAGHVKAAIALAQQGKLEGATTSLRAALALEFDIELADCIGRIDGLAEGTPVDLARFLPSWRDEVFADEDAFDIVVEGFDDDASVRTGPVRAAPAPADDFSDLADEVAGLDAGTPEFERDLPSARQQDLVPTVPIDSADAADMARAGALGRARYVGVAPPPPAHRRSTPSGNALDEEQTTGSYASVPDEVAWSGQQEFGETPSAGPVQRERLAEPSRVAAPPAPVPAIEAWADQPSVRRVRPIEPELASVSQAQPDWAAPTPLPAPPRAAEPAWAAPAPSAAPPPVRAAEPAPAEPGLDVTPAPSYYDPLRDTPAMNPPSAPERDAFGVMRNSSVRRTRAQVEAAPVEAAPQAPRRIDELLADAVQLMRRGDLALADAAIERILEREPRNAEALNLRSGLRKQLASVRMRALEPLDRTPRQNLRSIMSSGAALTPRRMFILNLVDGTTTLRDIIDLSGAPAEEASELLLGLIDDGLILLR